MDPSLFNEVGLLFDIVGVVLVWRYGLPPSVDRMGLKYIVTSDRDESEIAKARRYDSLSHIGLGLIVTGFLLQLLSNVMR
jgi:hypothetical protein